MTSSRSLLTQAGLQGDTLGGWDCAARGYLALDSHKMLWHEHQNQRIVIVRISGTFKDFPKP